MFTYFIKYHFDFLSSLHIVLANAFRQDPTQFQAKFSEVCKQFLKKIADSDMQMYKN